MQQIPGKYPDEFYDPMINQDIIPLFTNSSGMVSFEKLIYSSWGTASSYSDEGQYIIEFACDGVTSLPKKIQVKSSIASIKWIENVPSVVTVYTDVSYDFVITLRLLNKDDEGIPGKMPLKLELIPLTNSNPSKGVPIRYKLRNDIDLFQESTPDGLISLYIKITEVSVLDQT